MTIYDWLSIAEILAMLCIYCPWLYMKKKRVNKFLGVLGRAKKFSSKYRALQRIK